MSLAPLPERLDRYARLLASRLHVAETEPEFKDILGVLNDVAVGVRVETLLRLAEQLLNEGRVNAAQYVHAKCAQATVEMGSYIIEQRRQNRECS